MLPTFLIAGAAKSGSTTLWELLKAHPQVFMAPMKEVNFFITDVWWARYPKGIDWYSSLFTPKEEFKAYGEASINYMARPESAGLIRQHLPNVILLFILRNPVDRIYSQYWYERQEGANLPSFEKFVQGRHPLLDEWIQGGRYDLHLQRFLKLFPKKQIHIFLFDDLKANPEQLMMELYRTVGVDDHFTPRDLAKHANPTRQIRSTWFQRLIIGIERVSYPIQFPSAIQRPMHKLRMRLRKANARAISIPSMNPEQRRILLEEFSETFDFLDDLLGRPLPGWSNIL